MLLKSLIIVSLLIYPSVANALEIRYVDVKKILSDSKPALEAKAHVRDASRILEDGYEKLKKAWANSPQNEKDQVLKDGLDTLRKQLAIEDHAAAAIVANLLQEEIRKWRKANNIDLVLARQDILDGKETLDITSQIMEKMDAQTPKFAPLPTVSVKDPEPQNQEQSNKKAPAKRKK